jgi:hypothetical protein
MEVLCPFVGSDRVIEGVVSLAGKVSDTIFNKLIKIKGIDSDGWIK